MAKVKLHKAQLEVALDEHRFRVLDAGRRFGKSVLARMIVLKWATDKQGLYWIVSPTYRQNKNIHWRDFKKEIPKEWITKTNESELSVTLKNGSIIELKGAENPDSLRGVKLRGLVVDEVASIKNWDWLWHEVLRPTLTDYEAPALFISTPKGFNHFHDLFNMGQGDDEMYKSWRFTSYDNPYIPKEELDQAKLELTDDAFAQEYMADFRKHTGLIYKDFDRELHVIEPFYVPEDWQVFRGIDFGSRNPTACVWGAVDNDNNVFITHEHYSSGETIDYHAGQINAAPLSGRVSSTYGDPSGVQWMKEFGLRGVHITPANKQTGTSSLNWVGYGIEKVSELLKPRLGHTVVIPKLDTEDKVKVNAPSLFVFSTCTNLVTEFETYRWKEKATTQAQDLNEPETPEKANDHLLDALRYLVVSYQRGQPNNEYIPQNDFSKWSIG